MDAVTKLLDFLEVLLNGEHVAPYNSAWEFDCYVKGAMSGDEAWERAKALLADAKAELNS